MLQKNHQKIGKISKKMEKRYKNNTNKYNKNLETRRKICILLIKLKNNDHFYLGKKKLTSN